MVLLRSQQYKQYIHVDESGYVYVYHTTAMFVSLTMFVTLTMFMSLTMFVSLIMITL